MQLKNRKPLGLEALEDRWVPATVRFDGSNLFVTNPLITGGKSSITVVESLKGAVESFQVLDGAANNGSFAVTGNITINGNNAKNTVAVKVDATGGLSGNLSVTTGNGASSVSVDGTAAKAFVAGNTHINVGNNANTVTVGNTVGVTNKGSLSVNARGTGANVLTVGGGANPSGVLGNTQVSGFPTVTLGGTKGDLFAGNVAISNGNNGLPSTILLQTGASVLGNFTLQGGQGATTVNLNASVLGTAALNLGNNTNLVFLDGVVATPVSLGNLFFTGGNGTNALIVTGVANSNTILGNAVLNWGNGANSIGATTGLTVNGNLSINNGNGSLDVGTSPFHGNIFGNLNVNTGNGNNSFALDVTGGANVGGTFSYQGGNGGNSVTINNTTANVTQLQVRFGNNSANLMTLNAGSPGTGNLTGVIAWGVPTTASGTNGFVDNGYVWQNVITLINVPS